MKRLIILAPLLVIGPACLLGDNLPVCAVASFATYQSYGDTGCTVGGTYVFKDFSYAVSVSILANVVNAADITVTPTLNGSTPTLTFTANWGVNGTGLQTGLFTGVLGFRAVTMDSLFSAFNSVQLNTQGANTSGIATNLVSEEDCVGGLLTGALCSVGGGTSSTINASIAGTNLGANAVVSFMPSTTVDVIKTISLVSVLGSDTLSSIGQTFGTTQVSSATPEPESLALMGGGLIAIALGRFLKRMR